VVPIVEFIRLALHTNHPAGHPWLPVMSRKFWVLVFFLDMRWILYLWWCVIIYIHASRFLGGRWIPTDWLETYLFQPFVHTTQKALHSSYVSDINLTLRSDVHPSILRNSFFYGSAFPQQCTDSRINVWLATRWPGIYEHCDERYNSQHLSPPAYLPTNSARSAPVPVPSTNPLVIRCLYPRLTHSARGKVNDRKMVYLGFLGCDAGGFFASPGNSLSNHIRENYL